METREANSKNFAAKQHVFGQSVLPIDSQRTLSSDMFPRGKD